MQARVQSQLEKQTKQPANQKKNKIKSCCWILLSIKQQVVQRSGDFLWASSSFLAAPDRPVGCSAVGSGPCGLISHDHHHNYMTPSPTHPHAPTPPGHITGETVVGESFIAKIHHVTLIRGSPSGGSGTAAADYPIRELPRRKRLLIS